jgi:hypothetical protein
MAITASGLYGLTLEKMFIDTAGQSLEAETHKALLVLDAYTHNYDTHDFRDDITNEATGTAYTTGGVTITTTEITVGSPAVGTLKYDHDDVSWAASTIANAMALVGYFNVGSAATDQLVYLLDFVTAVTTSAGLLLVQINANGVFNLDYTP